MLRQAVRATGWIVIGGLLVSALATLGAAATYPAGVRSFTTKAPGQTIQPAHINDLQDEVTAIEDGLINGIAHAMTFNAVTTFAAVATFLNTGLHLLDTDASHDLIVKPGSNLTADRTLTLTTGDANRTLTLSADVTLSGTPYVAGGTDVALADGGTGASLVDPNADRILFWDDSAGAFTFLTPGAGLALSGTTLTAGGYALQFGGGRIAGGATFSPADATTYYVGQYHFDTHGNSTTANVTRVYVPRPGTVTSVRVNFRVHSTLGSGETSTVVFRRTNCCDTTISTAAVQNATYTTVVNDAMAVAMGANDYFEIVWTTPTWATNPLDIAITGVAFVVPS